MTGSKNDTSSNISDKFEENESRFNTYADMAGNLDLRILRKRNINKLIIAHLNINSLRNKFDFLKEQIQDYVDILMISETKLDESFPMGQF